MTAGAIILLAVAFVFIGWQVQTEDRTVAEEKAGRGSGILETASSLFAVIGSGEYGFAIALVIAYGFLGTSFLLALGLAFIAASIIAKHIRYQASVVPFQQLRVDGYTNFSTPDYFAAIDGKFSSLLVTCLGIVAFVLILLLQFVVGGNILSLISGIPYTGAVLLMAATVTLYCWLGGFRALFHTDVYQGILMWIAIGAACIFIIFGSNRVIELSAFNEFVGTSGNSVLSIFSNPEPLILFILTFAAAFSGPDVWQRMNTAESDSISKKALVGSGISLILFSLPVIVLALDVSMRPELVGSQDAFFDYLGVVYGQEIWPAFILAVFGIGLLAAFVSTADTALMLLLTLTQNELRRYGHWSFQIADKGRNHRDSFTKQSRYLLAAYAFLGVVLALMEPGIVETFGAVIGVLSLVGLPTLITYLGFGRKGFLPLVFIASIILFVYTAYFPPTDSQWWGLLPLVPAVLLLSGRRPIRQGVNHGQEF